MLAVSISIGVDVGIHNQSPSSNAAVNPSATPSMTSAALPTSTAAPPLSINGALDDTSLASCMTSDGNGHLFFQDVNGTLRHATCTAAGNWLPSVDFILTQQVPRNYTPISVAESFSTDGSAINIFFATTNDTLAGVNYFPSTSPKSGVQKLITSQKNVLNDSFVVSSSARSLSVNRLYSSFSNSSGLYNQSATSPFARQAGLLRPGTHSNVTEEVVLYYASPSQSVTVLQGLRSGLGPSSNSTSLPPAHDLQSASWLWHNVSEFFFPINASDPNGRDRLPSAPFSSTINAAGNVSYECFYNRRANDIVEAILGSEMEDLNSTSKFNLIPYFLPRYHPVSPPHPRTP